MKLYLILVNSFSNSNLILVSIHDVAATLNLDLVFVDDDFTFILPIMVRSHWLIANPTGMSETANYPI